jgi:hypothetical protein
VGAEGELTVDTTKKTVVVHDNVVVGGFPLARESLSNVPAGSVTSAMIADGAVTPAKAVTAAGTTGTTSPSDGGFSTSKILKVITAIQSQTVLQSLAELAVPLPANATTFFRFCIFYSTDAAADLKYGWNGPTLAGQGIKVKAQHIVPGGTAYVIQGISTAYNTTGVAATTNTNGTGYIELEGAVTNTTAGNLLFTYAQNTSSTIPTNILLGSYVTYSSVA